VSCVRRISGGSSPAEWDLIGSLLGDKSHSIVFDNHKLKRLVPDYTATVRFDQRIRRAVEYILRHPECQKEDAAFDKRCDNVVAAQGKAVKNVLQASTDDN